MAKCCTAQLRGGGRSARRIFVYPEGRIISVLYLEIAGGLVRTVRLVINPHKLCHFDPGPSWPTCLLSSTAEESVSIRSGCAQLRVQWQ